MSNRMIIAAACAAFALVAAAPDASAGLPWGKKKDKDEATASEQPAEAGVQRVKGRNGVEGEIVGSAKPGSAFSKLEIGMVLKQVNDILYAAGHHDSDCGVYETGKRWIPYYFGGDKSREECTYKGLGRLIFTVPSDNDSRKVLLKIVHDAAEDGYR